MACSTVAAGDTDSASDDSSSVDGDGGSTGGETFWVQTLAHLGPKDPCIVP